MKRSFLSRAMLDRSVFCALAAGSFFVLEANARPVTYAEDIAPILFEHCASCHRPGQIAPMSMLTYEETRPWAKAIRREVSARSMPPFLAAGPVGRYVDDPRLTEAEIALIQEWVDSGAMRGDAQLTPERPVFPTGGWQLGEPDLIVDLPVIETNPDASDDFYFAFSGEIADEDLWIRGIELHSERPESLHHANIFTASPEEVAGGPNLAKPGEVGGWLKRGLPLLPWLPGQKPRFLPEGAALRIPANTGLVADCHYLSKGKVVRDRLRIGLHFASGTIDRHEQLIAVNMNKFLMAPHMPRTTRTFREEFPVNAFVNGFGVHMHYRGVESYIEFEYPDGAIERVFEIPDWNQDWQQDYVLVEPMSVPAGTRVRFVGAWDNTSANPRNPAPERGVIAGVGAMNEMYTGRIYYLPETHAEQAFVVENGKRVDSAPPANAGF